MTDIFAEIRTHVEQQMLRQSMTKVPRNNYNRGRQLDMPCGTGAGIKRYPWSRMSTETAAQYSAFQSYLELGPTRSVSQISDTVTGSARNWATINKWRDRAAKYDVFEENERTLTMRRAKREMNERQARIAVKMQTLAEDTLDAGVVLPEKVADVVRLVEAGSRVERLARGEATENVATISKFVWSAPLPPWAPAQLLAEDEAGNKEVTNLEGDNVTVDSDGGSGGGE